MLWRHWFATTEGGGNSQGGQSSDRQVAPYRSRIDPARHLPDRRAVCATEKMARRPGTRCQTILVSQCSQLGAADENRNTKGRRRARCSPTSDLKGQPESVPQHLAHRQTSILSPHPKRERFETMNMSVMAGDGTGRGRKPARHHASPHMRRGEPRRAGPDGSVPGNAAGHHAPSHRGRDVAGWASRNSAYVCRAPDSAVKMADGVGTAPKDVVRRDGRRDIDDALRFICQLPRWRSPTCPTRQTVCDDGTQ